MYTRDTELRRLQSNDVNRLAETLGFDGGRKLMENIPKQWSNQEGYNVDDSVRGSQRWNGSSVIELKYKPEQIRLIEEATRQTSGCYFAEILIQEWSTSGRKHERPTVGLLLQLLIKADLWNAADFVAEHFLNEPPPERPLEGPGAKVDISIPTECLGSVVDFVNDSVGYPDTETLNDNVNCTNGLVDHNRDYYTKIAPIDKDLNTTAPKPPPRTRSARHQNIQNSLQHQLQTQQQTIQKVPTNNEIATVEANDRNGRTERQENFEVSRQPQNVNSSMSNTMTTHNVPELSDLLKSNSSHDSTLKSEDLHEIPNLSLLVSKSAILPSIPVVASTSKAAPTSMVSSAMIGSLPLITELNFDGVDVEVLNDLQGDNSDSNQLPHQITSPSPNGLSDDSHCSSLSNDSFDDGEYIGVNMLDAGIVDTENADGNSCDQSLPNLSVFGRQSPNNDSSLTTVTGTSGDNSFELSLNESSSTSTTDPTTQRK
ncbi:protein Tube [Zeugodacus cucurbitae]|uniref:Protein Tube n=1 Tax=Zeugodacus cucurbitae TaxID=28588 RepID=A0A0A1WSD6_ZEUCU|nr:protein Tube [Zeugodacus cucurbitae]